MTSMPTTDDIVRALPEIIDWLEMESLVFRTDGKRGNAEFSGKVAGLFKAFLAGHRAMKEPSGDAPWIAYVSDAVEYLKTVRGEAFWLIAKTGLQERRFRILGRDELFHAISLFFYDSPADAMIQVIPYFPERPTLCIIFSAEGLSHFVTDHPDIDILSVDNNCPSDRVYRFSDKMIVRVISQGIKAVLGDDPIGEMGDRPNEEQAARAHHARRPDGKPSLTVIEDGEEK